MMVVPAPAGAAPAFGPVAADLPEDPASPGTQLANRTSWRCLDVDSGTEWNVRTNVQLYNCRSGGDQFRSYQQFRKISYGSYFKIYNVRTGKCLTYNSDLALGYQVWADSSCQLNGQGWEDWEEWDPTTGSYYDMLVPSEHWGLAIAAVSANGGNMTGINLQDRFHNPSGNHRRMWVIY
ncbi:RICIN domain-containing protein [Virgisporangium ochraceum]|nr:hypothetical protein [Virgisporangium ochraceum]